MGKTRKIFILTLMILAWLFAGGINAYAESSILPEARTLIEAYYVDPVTEEVLEADSVEEILQGLDDPHSIYMTAQEFEEFLNSLDESFCGIGVYFEMEPLGARIISVMPESPAEKAGIKAGDMICKANRFSLEGITSEKAQSMIKGAKGSKVVLQVKREEKILYITVIRDEIEVPSAHGKLLDDNTAYIVIEHFGNETGKQMEGLIREFKAEKVSKWIIDLRNNPGGYVKSAAEIAGYFINAHEVTNMKFRKNEVDVTAVEQEEKLDGAVVVLVNENSASAAEILAAALKDYGRAAVIGKQTYGKGTVQQMMGLSNGDVLKLTIARFYSPKGNNINKVGVVPHIDIEEENMIKAAVLLLSDCEESDRYRIDLEQFSFVIDASRIEEKDNKAVWEDIIEEPLDVYHWEDMKWQQVSAGDMILYNNLS